MRCSLRTHIIRRLRPLLAPVFAAGVVIAATPGVAAAAAGFGDVADDEFYTEAVAWMVGESITTGIEAGCFGPDDTVTRGQVATFLFRVDSALGNAPRAEPHPFLDVTAHYQQEPVGWLHATGVTTGTSLSTFSPHASITRGDFAVMLWRYAGSPEAKRSHGFGDVTRDYQQKAVSWLAETGLTTGTSTVTFDPHGTVTRGQAAAFLHRFAGVPAVAFDGEDEACTRPLRVVLMLSGLTRVEAMCAAPHLMAWDITYLRAAAVGEIDVSQDWDLLFTVARVGRECMTPERVAQLTRVFL